MHPSLECSLVWEDWSSLSPGLCGHGSDIANPGVQFPGLKQDFLLLFSPRAGWREASTTSALATDYSIGRGGGLCR